MILNIYYRRSKFLPIKKMPILMDLWKGVVYQEFYYSYSTGRVNGNREAL